VLWRPGPDGRPELALVHRPRYDDWSLPKGKVDPGEHLLTCAVREVEEETGFTAVLGRPLGEQRYPVTTKHGDAVTKVVRYWAARATGGAFVPNEEVDELAWLPPDQAAARLSHDRDQDVLDAMLRHPDTMTIVLVRHANAGSRAAWKADDRLRPLDETGKAQAAATCAVLPVFGPERVLSADLVRCVDTVRPLAEKLRLPVLIEPALCDDAYDENDDRAVRRLDALVAQGRPVVLCSQGDAVPGLVARIAERDGVDLGAGKSSGGKVESSKGSAWALSFAAGRLVDAEYVPRLSGT